MDKPIYKSKKHIIYVFTAVLLFASLLMNAPANVSEHLAAALGYSLPVLIAGQAYVDSKRTSVPTGNPDEALA